MKEITEDYVNFEIAKILKEKGFDITLCNTCYKYNGKFCNNRKSMSGVDNMICYPAPTLQMAMKWLRELGIVITIQTKYPTNPELCKIPYSFLIEDYRPERDLQKEHGKYHTGYSSTAGMDDFLVKNNLLFDGLVFGEFKLYEETCEAAIKYCLTNLI